MARGGARPGERRGGRTAGTPNKATAAIKELAGQYSDAAVKRLAWLMENAESEAAQVAAAKELLDRAHGRPAQAIVGEEGTQPIELLVSWIGEIGNRGLPSEHAMAKVVESSQYREGR